MLENANIDERHVMGVDFGTLSGRALVVRVADGAELGTAVHSYPHGVIEDVLPATGVALPPDWALQDPDDYRDVLRHAVPAALAAAGRGSRSSVVGIGIDFTACTVLPTLADGTPLCEVPALRDRPHAYVKLWKHHAAQAQADRINALAHERGEPWIARYGGKISSEWQFAKALQLLEEDPEIYRRPSAGSRRPTGSSGSCAGVETRNVCTAGYKGIFQDGELSRPRDYLAALNPAFADFVGQARPSAVAARRPGRRPDRAKPPPGPDCRPGIAVAVGNVDAHVTAPAAQAIDSGSLLLIMGTSTCHVMNGDAAGRRARHVRRRRRRHHRRLLGLRGRAERRRRHLRLVRRPRRARRLPRAAAAAGSARTRCCPSWPRRSRSASTAWSRWTGGTATVRCWSTTTCRGVIVGLTLATRAEDVYRALLESTAFGTRMIIEAFENAGRPVTELVVAGGL